MKVSGANEQAARERGATTNTLEAEAEEVEVVVAAAVIEGSEDSFRNLPAARKLRAQLDRQSAKAMKHYREVEKPRQDRKNMKIARKAYRNPVLPEGVTVRGLAEKTGYSEPTISRVLMGERTPTLRLLEQLAEALGRSVQGVVKMIGEGRELGKERREQKALVKGMIKRRGGKHISKAQGQGQGQQGAGGKQA